MGGCGVRGDRVAHVVGRWVMPVDIGGIENVEASSRVKNGV